MTSNMSGKRTRDPCVPASATTHAFLLEELEMSLKQFFLDMRKTLTPKFIVLWLIFTVFGVFVLVPLLKLAWYELNPNMAVIRQRVGKQVRFVPEEGTPEQGTLVCAQYRLNTDSMKGETKWRVFDLWTRLEPWELWRVTPDPPENSIDGGARSDEDSE